MQTTFRVQRKSIHHVSKSNLKKTPYILGIETSCDDTCAAVLDLKGMILSNVKQSQLVQHLSFGGVLPSLSFQLHAESINQVVLAALRQAGVKNMQQIAAVGITTRPGLSLSLNVGLDYAKRLCKKYTLPMIPIHHMEAHALTALHRHAIDFPFLCLLISGGHSQLALFKRLDSIFLLGHSVDIAPGDLFDKLARELRLRNLGPPFDQISGGEAIERLAAFGRPVYSINRQPMNRKLNCDFSYSGMASATQQLIDRLNHQSNTSTSKGWLLDAPIEQVADICASIQLQVSQHLALRLHRSVKFLECSNLLHEDVVRKEQIRYQQIDYLDEKAVRLPLVISGGVACSDAITGFLRRYTQQMSSFYDQSQLQVFVPRPRLLCTDNAVMIAWNALLKYAYDYGFEDQFLNGVRIRKRLEKEENVSFFCLHQQNHVDSVKSEHKAPLGIDIRDLVEAFNISIIPVHLENQDTYVMKK